MSKWCWYFPWIPRLSHDPLPTALTHLPRPCLRVFVFPVPSSPNTTSWSLPSFRSAAQIPTWFEQNCRHTVFISVPLLYSIFSIAPTTWHTMLICLIVCVSTYTLFEFYYNKLSVTIKHLPTHRHAYIHHTMLYTNTLCVSRESSLDPLDPSGDNLEVSLNPVYSVTK